MDQKTNKISRILGQAGLISLLFALLFSCDTLESDQRPIESAELTNDAIYITPSNSGIINLRSLVHANMDVILQVASNPQHGSLTPLGNDLLQYKKNEDVTSATDGFLVSIFSSNNTFLKSDTVVIIVSPDSTNVPCNGLIANSDYVDYSDSVAYIDIAVLGNDYFCGIDSTLVEVSIPDLSISLPNHGMAEVISDNRIRYTPNSGFDGEDYFIYQVSYGDTIAFGYVYITSPRPCLSYLAIDDLFTFAGDSIASDTVSNTVYLAVLGNDSICGAVPVKYLVTQPIGSVVHADMGAYFYTFPDGAGAGFVDEFIYKICIGENQCSEALVMIKLE
jgi:hypothetical protein